MMYEHLCNFIDNLYRKIIFRTYAHSVWNTYEQRLIKELETVQSTYYILAHSNTKEIAG